MTEGDRVRLVRDRLMAHPFAVGDEGRIVVQPPDTWSGPPETDPLIFVQMDGHHRPVWIRKDRLVVIV